MPVNRLNNPILNSRNDFKVFEEQLQAGLERTIVHVLENRHEVHEKAKQCLEDIKHNCNPALYGKKLQLLYQGKVSSVAGGGF